MNYHVCNWNEACCCKWYDRELNKVKKSGSGNNDMM